MFIYILMFFYKFHFHWFYFVTMASFDLSYSQYTVLKEIWVSAKINALPPGTLFQLRKFRHETPISATCCRLDLTKVDA